MSALRDVWAETLIELAEDCPHLLVLDGDLANSTRADRFALAYPGRFFQMGIAEQNLMGVAAGLAHGGFIPWLSSFAVFFTHRAADPLRMLVAQTGANVKIGAAYSGLLTGYTGKTHQDVEDLAILRAMPHMTVLAPMDGPECREMTRWATAHPGPVYLRLARDPVEGPAFPREPLSGQPRLLREGDDLALVSTGPQSLRCWEAAELLARRGIQARVVHLGFLKPTDQPALCAALQGVPVVVTAEEHSVLGGLGGLVAELLSAQAPRRVLRLGLEDTFGESASNQELLELHGLSPQRMAQRIESEMLR